jgi:hypothetical protein
VEQSISVSVDVSHDGVQCKLVRESGSVPQCVGAQSCILYRADGPVAVTPRSCVVLNVRSVDRTRYGRGGVLFADLTASSLRVVGERVVPLLLLPFYSNRRIRVDRVSRALAGGMFASDGGCLCRANSELSVCAACIRVRPRFVSQECFSGVNPCGTSHWFNGLSDGVGHVPSLGGPWLACWCRRGG